MGSGWIVRLAASCAIVSLTDLRRRLRSVSSFATSTIVCDSNTYSLSQPSTVLRHFQVLRRFELRHRVRLTRSAWNILVIQEPPLSTKSPPPLGSPVTSFPRPAICQRIVFHVTGPLPSTAFKIKLYSFLHLLRWDKPRFIRGNIQPGRPFTAWKHTVIQIEIKPCSRSAETYL
ncbi:hypothetical protein C8R44DRAFT_798881 [Mycena epipterygia]|nr:hypothetical protein C8R44DRAFT_798881 [Mycena epipterygia]